MDEQNVQTNEETNEETTCTMLHCIPMSTLMGALSCSLVSIDMPRHNPRNLGIILKKFRKMFIAHEKTKKTLDMWHIDVETRKEMREFLNDILFNIPEFVELNLTPKEYAEGKRAFDVFPPRPLSTKFEVHFVTRDSKIAKKSSFIDLDAAVNVTLNYLKAITLWESGFCLKESRCGDDRVRPFKYFEEKVDFDKEEEYAQVPVKRLIEMEESTMEESKDE